MGFFSDVKAIGALKDEKSKLEKELKALAKELNAQEELTQTEKLQQEIEDLKRQLDYARISVEGTRGILVSTSTICEKFEVLDTVFAIEVHKDSLFGGLFGGGAADPFSVFSGVNEILRKQCHRLGGNAVINCQFNWETGVSSEVLGVSIPGFSRKVHMIYAYGTAVKYIP